MRSKEKASKVSGDRVLALLADYRCLQEKYDLLWNRHEEQDRRLVWLDEKCGVQERCIFELRSESESLQETRDRFARENELLARNLLGLTQDHHELKDTNDQLKQANSQLSQQNGQLAQHNGALTVEKDELAAENNQLVLQNEWFKRQLFGRKSEKRIVQTTQTNQLCLGEMLDVEDTPPPPAETVKSYQRRQRRKQPMEGSILESGLRFDSSVPIEEIEIPNTEIKGLDPSKYEIVTEKVTHRLAQRPGSYVILRYVRKVAKIKETGKLCCPAAPASVLEKSYGDVSFLAGLIVDKFAYHLPLYRQHQRLRDCGIELSRGTLTNLVHRSIDLLEPIYYAMLSSILQSQVLTMDETPIKATRMKDKHKMRTAYFWPVYGDKDEVAFLFSLSRASPIVRETLQSFCGVLVSDGYKAYEAYVKGIDTVTHAQCWAHTRRKFFDAQGTEPTQCNHALDQIGKLYEIEEHIRSHHLTGIEKAQYRAEHSKPLVDQFFLYLQQVFAQQILLPTSPFAKAAHYALDREKALRVFLEYPDVPIDTNHIERQIRPIAIGRKNWLFCWTEVGARYAGMAHSLIASCRLQGIDPYTYFVDVLQRVETHPVFEVHRLTPRLWKEIFAQNPLRSDISSFPPTRVRPP